MESQTKAKEPGSSKLRARIQDPLIAILDAEDSF
jgi:hypothetical protein